jgi:hypothetical protein
MRANVEQKWQMKNQKNKDFNVVKTEIKTSADGA